MQSESIKELATALAKVQANIKPVKKDKTAKIPTKSGGSYTYHYADLSSVWDACRELLTSNGLSVVQMPEAANGGSDIYLSTILMHSSGEWLSSMLLLRPTDTTPQALGSAITYARRYALAAMVGIVADEHDDGNAASQPAQQRAAQAQPTNGNLASEPQKKKLFAIWKNGGFDGKLQDWIKESYGCDIDAISMKDASAAIELLQPSEQPA